MEQDNKARIEELLNAALDYAKKGLKVFPLRVGEKIPLKGLMWKEAATSDIEKIKEWWKHHPYNIAIAAGADSGFWVLDIDVKNGGKGKESFNKLKIANGPLNKGPLSCTASGGAHIFFLYKEGESPRCNITGLDLGNGDKTSGLDVKTDAGYIVAPPSYVGEGQYKWVNGLDDYDFMEAPEWLLGYTNKVSTDELKAEAIKTYNASKDAADKKGWAKIQKQYKISSKTKDFIKNGASNGERNDRLLVAVKDLIGNRVPQDKAYEMAWAGAEACGISHEEFTQTFNSAISTPCYPSMALAEANDKLKPKQEDKIVRLDQKGIADKFIQSNQNFRHTSSHGWLYYNKLLWEKDEKGVKTHSAMCDFLRQCEDAASGDEKKLYKCNWNNMSAIWSAVIMHRNVSVSSDLFDNEPLILYATNGCIDLMTGNLTEAKKEHYCTQRIATHYDPNAKCPRWEKFIEEIMDGDKGKMRFLKAYAGYCLLGHANSQCLSYLLGRGANGKSVFVQTLADLLGDYSTTINIEQFLDNNNNGPKYELAGLRGKRMVTTSEPNRGKKLDVALIKKLTGNEEITARGIFKSPEKFKIFAKFFISSNHELKVDDDSDGFWRRVKMVRFERQFNEDKADHKLSDKLKTEFPGILNWLLEGCKDYNSNGVIESQEMKDEAEEYKLDQDLLLQFIQEKTEPCHSNDVTANNLYNAYLDWCKDRGIELNERFSQTRFGREIKNRIKSKRLKKCLMYLDVKIKGLNSKPSFDLDNL